MILYKCQLKFYFRCLDLPSSRWVKQAMLDHLSLLWPSPYLNYITSIRRSIRLTFLPPTQRYLAIHLEQWALAETNSVLESRTLPYVEKLTKFRKQPYVYDHEHLDTIAQFRLSNAGLGNRGPRFPAASSSRVSSCPLCTTLRLSEGHVVFFCPSIESYREEFGLVFFRNVCLRKGYSEESIFKAYVNGLDWNGTLAYDTDFVDRGHALDTMRGHWLSKW